VVPLISDDPVRHVSYFGRRRNGRRAVTVGCVKRFVQQHGIDVLTVAAAVAAFVEAFSRAGEPNGPDLAPGVAAVAVLVPILPLLARRRAPFGTPAWLWVAAAALSFADGRLITSVLGVYAAGLISAFLLGSLRDEVQGRIGLAIVLVGGLIIALNDPGSSLGEAVLIPAPFLLAWLGGLANRKRDVQAREAEERARAAEREREIAARIAVAEERARIARELHDIVAHAVSVMVLQVGAVRHRLPRELDEDAEVLRGVEDTGRSSLGEMRRLLGAMRGGDEAAELAPSPGLDRLDVLLEESRRAGLPVDVHIDGDPSPLPAALDLTAYRIVQEGLTNARKHAHASHAEVRIGYAGDELRIEVSDDGHGAADDVASRGPGHGLVGIRERVNLYGGSMTAAGGGNGDGFRLTMSLPLTGSGA
jgi:signal transduction histidine kinase